MQVGIFHYRVICWGTNGSGATPRKAARGVRDRHTILKVSVPERGMKVSDENGRVQGDDTRASFHRQGHSRVGSGTSSTSGSAVERHALLRGARRQIAQQLLACYKD